MLKESQYPDKLVCKTLLLEIWSMSKLVLFVSFPALQSIKHCKMFINECRKAYKKKEVIKVFKTSNKPSSQAVHSLSSMA